MTVDFGCGQCIEVDHSIGQSTEVVRALAPVIRDPGLTGSLTEHTWAVLGGSDSDARPFWGRCLLTEVGAIRCPSAPASPANFRL